MASPLAQGLFVRAIGESGGAFSATQPWQPAAIREAADAAFMEKAAGTSDLAALRALSADDILKASKAKVEGAGAHFTADIDGYFLPESVASIYAEGKQAHIPLLAGWNHDEGGGGSVLRGLHGQSPLEALHDLAEKSFPTRSAEFLSVYAATDDTTAGRALQDYAGDRFIAYSTWAWLEAQVKTGEAPVYRYKFDRPAPADKFHPADAGTFHSDDIEYVFGVLDSRPGAVWSPDDYKLSDLIETYWTNFAKTGNPNGGDAPNWPQYKPEDWLVMHLDATSEASPDTHRNRDLFLQQAWSQAEK
jgi:para-nitrobenzyl esterase